MSGRYRMALATLFSLLLTGCGATAVAPTAPSMGTVAVTTMPTTRPTATTVGAAPSVAVRPPGPAAPPVQTMSVGGKATLPDGQTITVYRVEFPAPMKYPSPGNVGFDIDIEWCAGASPAQGAARVGSDRFTLTMSDNTRSQYSPATERLPALFAITLGPNDCERGWLVFSLTEGVTPRTINYEGRDPQTSSPILIKWELQR